LGPSGVGVSNGTVVVKGGFVRKIGIIAVSGGVPPLYGTP